MQLAGIVMGARICSTSFALHDCKYLLLFFSRDAQSIASTQNLYDLSNVAWYGHGFYKLVLLFQALFYQYFRCGADKISIGSDAVYAAEEYLRTGVKSGKSSFEQISRVYGNQAVVVSIDPCKVYVKNQNDIDVEFETIRVTNPVLNFVLKVRGGREIQRIRAYELTKAVEELGAGEILLNCIDYEGQGKGI
ncbi:imidazole glycerol phosphate synthase hisHF, chloroplastic-like isoform X2 [Rosa rugosa]|nr:imidazole glycerol phosphate synthase hisHF, chloroplastic-like isoform X2 [Rosa rugosa]XP_061990255.1 imidazole glycerol phosphate synthase hisHF, chloroplastic-like isoform X2 [Rosa rugosa]